MLKNSATSLIRFHLKVDKYPEKYHLRSNFSIKYQVFLNWLTWIIFYRKMFRSCHILLHFIYEFFMSFLTFIVRILSEANAWEILSSWNSDCNSAQKICWLCLLSESILLKDSLYIAPMHVLHVILVFILYCLTLSTINDVFFFFLHDHHLDLLSLYEPKKLLIIVNIQCGPSMILQRNHTGSQP